MAELLKHQEILKEYGLDAKTLPLEIRDKIRILTPLIKRYNNAVDDGKPSDSLKDAVIKQDVEIADMIADHLEKDLPSEADLLALQEEERKKADAIAEATRLAKKVPSEPTEEEKAAIAKKKEDDAVAAKKAEDEANEKAKLDAIAVQENEVMAIINSRSDRRILTSDLAKIIGTSPSNPQVVGTKKFKTVFLNSAFYQEA